MTINNLFFAENAKKDFHYYPSHDHNGVNRAVDLSGGGPDAGIALTSGSRLFNQKHKRNLPPAIIKSAA